MCWPLCSCVLLSLAGSAGWIWASIFRMTTQMSKQSHISVDDDVASTLIWRCFQAVCLMGKHWEVNQSLEYNFLSRPPQKPNSWNWMETCRVKCQIQCVPSKQCRPWLGLNWTFYPFMYFLSATLCSFVCVIMMILNMPTLIKRVHLNHTNAQKLLCMNQTFIFKILIYLRTLKTHHPD